MLDRQDGIYVLSKNWRRTMSELEIDTLPINRIWIGDNYQQDRIFVLGESWYGDYVDNTDAGYVALYLDGKLKDSMYTRMANACGLSRHEFWHRIAFTNFVQRVGDTRDDRPTKAMYEEAKMRLEKLLIQLPPSGVWVLGKEQSEYSGPIISKAGIPFAVTPHPTSYGLTNVKLGESWLKLMEIMQRF